VIVGVPKEIKLDEYRVAMLPVGVEELVGRGHQVLIEAGAGLGSGLADHDYLEEGAELVARAGDLRAGGPDRESQGAPAGRVRLAATGPGHLHVLSFCRQPRADRSHAGQTGATCVAYETLRDEQGRCRS
jgi:alanine dehydrogenase